METYQSDDDAIVGENNNNKILTNHIAFNTLLFSYSKQQNNSFCLKPKKKNIYNREEFYAPFNNFITLTPSVFRN